MTILKINILLILILISGFSFGQTKTELRISKLIEKLNWETIPIDCQYALTLTDSDSIANQIVKFGKRANKQLLSQISNPEKSIGIHIILTRINEPNTYENIGLGTKYIYKNCDNLIGWHHIYNGIVWEWFKNKGQTITESELKKLTDYWNNKLIGKQKIELSDSETIFNFLRESDSKNYPCVK